MNNRTYLIAGAAGVVLLALLFMRLGDPSEQQVEASADGTAAMEETESEAQAATDADITAGEGDAGETEVATSDTGAASNAATDAAVEEIAEGDSPTSADAVEASREAASAEGATGGDAWQPETYDRDVVMAEIDSSDLDATVKVQLAAELDSAEGDPELLEGALEEVRTALAEE